MDKWIFFSTALLLNITWTDSREKGSKSELHYQKTWNPVSMGRMVEYPFWNSEKHDLIMKVSNISLFFNNGSEAGCPQTSFEPTVVPTADSPGNRNQTIGPRAAGVTHHKMEQMQKRAWRLASAARFFTHATATEGQKNHTHAHQQHKMHSTYLANYTRSVYATACLTYLLTPQTVVIFVAPSAQAHFVIRPICVLLLWVWVRAVGHPSSPLHSGSVLRLTPPPPSLQYLHTGGPSAAAADNGSRTQSKTADSEKALLVL